jgi:hypothetical protein
MEDQPQKPAPKRARRKLSRRRKLIFIATAMFLGLLLTEGVLQIVCLVWPSVHYAISDDDPPAAVSDATLGQHPNPEVSEHDSAGWRNPERLEQADIVCIGDSQTYGTSCHSEEAWPLVLGEDSGHSSYSMAFGGYGPTQYLALTPEALELKPKLLLVAVYAGNDIADCYRAVYVADTGSAPELRSTNADTLAALKRADEKQTFGADWSDLQAVVRPPGSHKPSFRHKLSTWFRLYGVVRTIRKRMTAKAEAAKAHDPERIEKKWKRRKQRAEKADNPNMLLVYEHGKVRTNLTPQARDDALDMGDPRVREGLRITRQCLECIIDACDGKTKLAVVFIPTKELVFADAVREHTAGMPPALEKLLRDETELWEGLRAFLKKRNTPYIDTLPALRGCLEKDENPYLEQWDGHPNPKGNRAMAEWIAKSEPVKALSRD